jgi:hypothetical protein
MMSQETEAPVRWESAPAERQVPRVVIFVLVLLGGLLVTVGLASAWAFNHSNNLYSDLLKRSARDLDDVHDIAFHAAVGYANMMELSYAHNSLERTNLLNAMASQREANDQVFDDLAHEGGDAEFQSSLAELVAKRQACREVARAFEAVEIKADDRAAAERDARQLLLAYTEYQQAGDRLSNVIKQRSLDSNARVAEEARRLKVMFFAAGLLPLVIGFGLVVMSLVLIWSTPSEMDLH